MKFIEDAMKEKQETDKINEILQLVSFHIENEEFGIDILKVQEIIRMVDITKVPNSPEFVEGVINLRGKIIPIVDLRVRLGFSKIKQSNRTRVVVLDLQTKTIGFIVDEVNEVLRISTSIIEPPPSILSGINSEFITAVCKLEDRLLILLDLNKTFSFEEEQILKSIS